MSRRKQIYEGKAKILYEGPDPGTIVQYFKDDATAFNAEKHAILEGKGVLNNRISEFIMMGIGRICIPTHFIRRLNMREQLIHAVEIVPLEVVIRNVAAGSMVKRLGIKEGTALPRPLLEFYYKEDSLGDPLVTEEHISAFNWATHAELDAMANYAMRINDYLCGLFSAVGIKLVDFKIEFGRQKFDYIDACDGDGTRIILADEISPDSCRLWDMDTNESLDKDRFRKDLGGLTEAYSEVARRLGILKSSDETSDEKGPRLVSTNDLVDASRKKDT